MSAVLITGGSGFIGRALAHALARSHRVISIDLTPFNKEDETLTEPNNLKSYLGDASDARLLRRIVDDNDIDVIIHAAANANFSDNPRDYDINVELQHSVCQVCEDRSTQIKHLISFSTQYVCRPEYIPSTEHDFAPHTEYGKSKVACEKILRAASFTNWSIVRPSNVWGEGHYRNLEGLYLHLRKGSYLHIKGTDALRSYCYIGDLTQWMTDFVINNQALFNRVVYLSDPPSSSRTFLNMLSQSLRGRPLREMPMPFMQSLAFTGDILNAAGIRFPFYSDRLFRMTTDHGIPGGGSWIRLPPNKFSRADAVRATSEWVCSKLHR